MKRVESVYRLRGGPGNDAWRFVVALGVGLLAVACGGSTSTGPSSAAATPPSSSIVVKTASAMVAGRPETILTDGKGRSLYLFTPEKDGNVQTTPATLKVWQALVLPGAGAMAIGDPEVPGKLGAVTRPDGTRQVTYNEWPLYTFSGDTKPGDVNGQGVANQWFLVQAVMAQDADNDFDGTQPAPMATPAAQPAPAQATPQAAAPAQRPVAQPGFNDGDADNRGGPNDGDGNG
jgi:predicted lipoprotein with Yx(FWY)xxD motif